MLRHLFTVQDTFLLARHGLVLFPGIVPAGDEKFKIGSPLVLKRPDGTQLATKISGIELGNPNPRRELIVLLKGLQKDDVPAGTEVWSAPSE